MNLESLVKYITTKAVRFLLVFFLTILASLSYAKENSKFLFYIGGGEAFTQNPKATNFDYSFSYIRNIEKDNWKARYLFAGEQAHSKKLRQEVAEKSQPLTLANLVPFLAEIETALSEGKIDKGELLVYLDTHGVMDDGKYTITTTDGNFDILPALLRIRALAKQHAVKLGLIGATCFSGQLMNLEDSNTCVLTTAPADTVGLMMNNNVIAYLLGHSATKNLEQLHLQSRKFKDIDLGQPMISTAAGKKAFEVLKELRTTVLVAGKKSAPEIYSCDQNGIEKTLSNINALVFPPTKANDSVLISEKYVSKLKNLDSRLKSLLGLHREALISMLTNSCQSLNPDLTENPPCDLSKKSISERNTSTVVEKGIVLKPVELPKDLPSPEAQDNAALERFNGATVKAPIDEAHDPKQTLEELIKTSAEIGAIERDLYDLLYKKFSEEKTTPSICESFELN